MVGRGSAAIDVMAGGGVELHLAGITFKHPYGEFSMFGTFHELLSALFQPRWSETCNGSLRIVKCVFLNDLVNE